MKIALVAFSDRQEYRIAIKEEMMRRGHLCDLLYFPVLAIDGHLIEKVFEVLRHYDVVHFVLGFNEELSSVLQEKLSKSGVICPNSRQKSTNLNDKIVQMSILAGAGVSIPLSARLMRPTKEEAGEFLGFPFVLKEPVGSQGKKVFLCTEDNFDEVVKMGTEYLGQKFVNYVADYRVHVAGDKTFCIYERFAPAGDFRANVSLGGTMKKVDDPKILNDLSELALRTKKALAVDYGGIDIIRGAEDDLYVLEFNPNPGFKNVTDVTGTPFYKPIADYYESLLK